MRTDNQQPAAVGPHTGIECRNLATFRERTKLWEILPGKVATDPKITARRFDSDTGSGSPYRLCFRYDTISGWPSRIQPLKWPILKQNPSIFGWDMTQNGSKMFWVISQPNIDGFCFNVGHFKGWILLLDRPDTGLGLLIMVRICIVGVSTIHFWGAMFWIVLVTQTIMARYRVVEPLFLYP